MFEQSLHLSCLQLVRIEMQKSLRQTQTGQLSLHQLHVNSVLLKASLDCCVFGQGAMESGRLLRLGQGILQCDSRSLVRPTGKLCFSLSSRVT